MNQPLAVSVGTNVRAPPFSRTCQAAHLLSRVLRHMDDQAEMDPEFRLREALQLDRTLRTLALVLRDESDGLAALALCHSARLNLYDMYSCIDTTNVTGAGSSARLEMQKAAIGGLEDVSTEVFKLAKTIRQVIELEGLAKVSPLVVECLYQAAANYAWYIRETSKSKYHEMLIEVKGILHLIGYKWGAASKCLTSPSLKVRK